jgi:tetratricopeptide (TPR) repeat protein
MKKYRFQSYVLFITASALLCSLSCQTFKSREIIKPVLIKYPAHAQKMWALSTCAIINESNNERHDLLGGCLRTKKKIESWKKSLKKWWGVNCREDLLNTLDNLEKNGHSQQFKALGNYISSLTSDQLLAFQVRYSNQPEQANKIRIVLEHYHLFGEKSLLGWDLSRYISLCGWGYVVGYLSEDEAWEKLMPVAIRLQQSFDSWEDFGLNYTVGREFWSYNIKLKEGQKRRAIYKKMCTSLESSWNIVPWDLDLTPGFDDNTAVYENVFRNDDVEVLLRKAKTSAWEDNRNYLVSEAYLQSTLRVNPNHDEALRFYADILRRQGRTDKALVLINKSLAINPKRSIEYSTKAGILDKSGEEAKAISVVHTCIEESEGDITMCYVALKDIYMNNGDYESAINCLKEHLKQLGLQGENDKLFSEKSKNFTIASFLLTISDIYQYRLHDPQRALKNTERALFYIPKRCALKKRALDNIKTLKCCLGEPIESP